MTEATSSAKQWASQALSPALGREVTGLDAAALSDRDFDELRRCWAEAGGLLVLRGQRLTEAQHLAFARRFGPVFGDEGVPLPVLTNDPMIHPDWPQIVRVSNRIDLPRRRRIGTYWHSDLSYLSRPASASLLLALDIPRVGGDTLFASTLAAYRALSPRIRGILAPLRALHSFTYPNAPARSGNQPPPKHLHNLHPLLRRHPESGEVGLFVNPAYVLAIDGLTEAESDALLGFLHAHMARPEFVYRHRWQPQDLVIWDNRCLNHFAVPDYSDDEARHLHRITVMGEPPLAAGAPGKDARVAE